MQEKLKDCISTGIDMRDFEEIGIDLFIIVTNYLTKHDITQPARIKEALLLLKQEIESNLTQ